MCLLLACGIAVAPFALAKLPNNPGSSGTHPLAPDFALRDLNGKEVRLSSYRGKVVLLDFWATWCDPCRDEIPHFIEMQIKHGARGLQIIGISMDDSAGPVRDFYNQFHMNYPVVMGDSKTAERYGGVLGLPVAFVIDRAGHIYAKHIGPTSPLVFEKEVRLALQKRTPAPVK